MQILITARHCEVSDEVKEHAEALLRRLARYARRPIKASVVFDDDHQQKVVELRMDQSHGAIKVATGEAEDFRTALDRAANRLKQQLAGQPLKPARRA